MEDKKVLTRKEESEADAELSDESNILHEAIVRLKQYANSSTQPPDGQDEYTTNQLSEDIRCLLESQDELEERNHILHMALDIFRPKGSRAWISFFGGYTFGTLLMICVFIFNIIREQ